MTKGELLDIIHGVDDDTEILIDGDDYGKITNVCIEHLSDLGFQPRIIIDYEL